MTVQTLPLRRTPLQTLWYWLYRLLGWNGEYRHPHTDKFIIIVAPHTSNLDFFIGFIYSRAFAMPFPNFLAKDSLFRGFFGPVWRWLGGIPVNRSERTNFVDQVAAEFQKRKRMILAITPEGTRSRSEYWKTGFYYMAQKANVPVIMASIDYARNLFLVAMWPRSPATWKPTWRRFVHTLSALSRATWIVMGTSASAPLLTRSRIAHNKLLTPV